MPPTKKPEPKKEAAALEKRFKFLEHTADALFESYGRNENELFENSAMAMCSVMYDTGSVKKVGEIQVEQRAEKLEGLLQRFLQDLLYEMETQNTILGEFNVQIKKQGNRYLLKAKCYGEPANEKKHAFKNEIKAVTYHGLKVEQDGKQWKARVLLDI